MPEHADPLRFPLQHHLDALTTVSGTGPVVAVDVDGVLNPDDPARSPRWATGRTPTTG
ncbi:hypothetical protein [Dactylosporangium cerinum]